MSWEHHSIEANGARLHYVRAGSGPLVLLLHGFPDFWYSWRYQLPALASHFTVIAPDLRGYNRSEAREPYDVATLVADVISLIEQLGGQAALVGHDWGGALAWLAAGYHPQHVRRLAALNMPHPRLALQHLRRNPRQMLRSMYIAFFQVPYLPELLLSARDYAIPLWAFKHTTAAGAVSQADLARYQAALRRSGLHGPLQYYRQPLQAGLGSISHAPLSIRVPTLQIWGERDPWLGRELLADAARYVPDYRERRIAWAGHWVHWDAAELVNRHLIDFLSEGDAAT